MSELYGWCVTEKKGWVQYNASHSFYPYETFFLRRPMYYCPCGKKICPEEYIEYSKYLIARKKLMRTDRRKTK